MLTIAIETTTWSSSKAETQDIIQLLSSRNLPFLVRLEPSGFWSILTWSEQQEVEPQEVQDLTQRVPLPQGQRWVVLTNALRLQQEIMECQEF